MKLPIMYFSQVSVTFPISHHSVLIHPNYILCNVVNVVSLPSETEDKL